MSNLLRSHRTIVKKRKCGKRNMNRQLKLTRIYDELLEIRTNKKIFLEKIEKIIP